MAKRRVIDPLAPHQGPRRLRDGEYGPARPGQWHDARFIEHPTKTHIACAQCGKGLWLPASRAPKITYCGFSCHAARVVQDQEARRRDCETCGTKFIPRATQLRQGGGRYCSRRCIPSLHLSTPENLAQAQAGKLAAIRDGRISYPTGASHHSWKGGEDAMIARRRASGRPAEYLRAWRRTNPDRVKEQRQRRSQGKLAALPYGTVPRIRRAQKDRCAICSVKLGGRGHLDHVQPIARGGLHEPRNLQLLCGPCNVRKSAKDPMTYMRELGRLL